ncbi:MAG TPA: YgaP-like transmembrane domain [Dehalococcoidia bacterium]
MERNVGTWDRVARAVFGVAVVAAALRRPHSRLLGLLGLYAVHDLACAALAYDPLFALAGVSTVPGAPNALPRRLRPRRRAVRLPGGVVVRLPARPAEVRPWRAIRSAVRR